IYRCVARLPDICRQYRFNYLSFFVDDECLHAVLVSKHGEVRSIGPMAISAKAVRYAGEAANPRLWGRPIPWSPGSRYPDTSDQFQPLVEQLDGLVRDGIIDDDDHLCWCGDAELHNVPLHYLRWHDGLILDRLSVSRVHSAFDLDRLLGHDAEPRPAA